MPAVPTMRDVALAAGVSHMTVSRVVRGERTVAAATADRVRAAIARLGYRPDPALSALARTRARNPAAAAANTILFLDCDRTAYTREVLAGAAAEAGRWGYRLETQRLPGSATARARLGRTLFHRGVRGLLVGPADHPERLDCFRWDHFAAVSLGALAHQPGLHAVGMDYFHALGLAADGLRAMGCRRPGLCLPPAVEARTAHQWLGAYLARDPAAPPPLWREPGTCFPAALRRWARLHQIDAALTVSAFDATAFAAAGLTAAYLNHFAIPPGAAHVAIDPAEIGREGARTLHGLLLDRAYGLPATPRSVALRGRWVAATAPPRSRASRGQR